jgi:hypothetical protein
MTNENMIDGLKKIISIQDKMIDSQKLMIESQKRIINSNDKRLEILENIIAKLKK